MKRVFLTAEWRKLLLVNYCVPPELLQSRIFVGTELDLWNGTCYVSLVGFLFQNTRLKGIPVPFHRHFEEINLRFYVRRNDAGTWKRGVVFIREIVPGFSLAAVANTVYGEHYVTRKMRHSVSSSEEALHVEYGWREGGRWHHFSVAADREPGELTPGSEAEFITEHYWGYTMRKQGRRTSEYEVWHPQWSVYPVREYSVSVDFSLYGSEFSFLTTASPVSVMLAEGSEIEVREGRMLF